jgi:hypothetical protein
VSARDLLRVSRLSLVVLLNLRPSPQYASKLLLKQPDDHHALTNHRIILITPRRQKFPEQLISNIASNDIPVISRPLAFESLLAHIAHAYAELGAHGKALDD